MEKTIQLNKVFKEFNQTKCRYRIAMGSAGSGKSVDIAMDYILKLSDPKYKGANLLVVRETDTSHKDSTFSELKAAIERLGQGNLWDIRYSPLHLKSKITGNTIKFRGCHTEDDRARIKSITVEQGKLCWCWIEEAFEVTEDSVNLIDDRLRGILPDNLYYQITLSFNPVNGNSYLKKHFWDYNSPDIFRCHSTYLDNRFIDEAYARRMERRKEIDPEGYRVYGLGEWGETGGLILTNYVIEDLPLDFSNYNEVHYSQDFGYNHANCILELGFKDDEMYVLREIYVHEKDTSEIIDLAIEFNFSFFNLYTFSFILSYFFFLFSFLFSLILSNKISRLCNSCLANKANISKSRIMYCDSAEPDRIKMWKKVGYRAVPVQKEPNSVKAQIDYLKQHRIHINGSCLNTIKEIQQWKWLKDKTTGEYTDEPVPIEDDAMACLRYGIEPYRKNNRLNKSALSL